MAKKESAQSPRMRELRSTGGIATWKLVVMVLFMVVLGALGAYSLQTRQSGGASPSIDFGFSSASTQGGSSGVNAG